MRKLTLSLWGVLGCCFVTLPATAQQVDNRLVLPDAKPGECYAKVITPARLEERTEEVVVQEASERIETLEAVFKSTDQSIVVQEASQTIEVTAATFTTETEEVEIRASELNWTAETGLPANPATIEQLAASGVDTDAAEKGSCFVEYFSQAQYEAEPMRVLVKEAHQRIKVTPAEFETVEQEVLVKEGSSEVVDVPAVYRTETESVLVEPARSVWRENCGVVEQVANATGDVMCLVELPARYETVTKTVLDKPATTKTIDIPEEFKSLEVKKLLSQAVEVMEEVPAEYEVVNKQVKVSDATFFWVAKGDDVDESAEPTGREICLTEVPAELQTIERAVLNEPAIAITREVPERVEMLEVKHLQAPASEKRIEVPQRIEVITSQVEVAPAQLSWKQVLCKVNMTREIIASLQNALKREGYDPGPADGFVGRGTLRAMEEYQIAEGLDRGGMTLELLKRLGVQS